MAASRKILNSSYFYLIVPILIPYFYNFFILFTLSTSTGAFGAIFQDLQNAKAYLENIYHEAFFVVLFINCFR